MRWQPLARVGLGEFLGSGVLVAVVLASGAVRVQLGALTVESALLGSITLGFGYGLVLWSFGSLSGAQTSPFVSVVASVLGHKPWPQTALRIASQIFGAATGSSLTVRLAPDTFATANAGHPVLEFWAKAWPRLDLSWSHWGWRIGATLRFHSLSELLPPRASG